MTADSRALFYHLTGSGLVETLMTILTRASGQGWRVMVRGTDVGKMENLDKRLWLEGGPEAFLPHGLEGGPQAHAQPVVLGVGPVPDGILGVLLIDGAELSVADARKLHRVWVLFDGADAAQVAQARGLWTSLTAGGLAAQYWAEENGRWTMKVEKAATG